MASREWGGRCELHAGLNPSTSAEGRWLKELPLSPPPSPLDPHLVLAACLVAPGPTDEQLLAAAGITGTRLLQPLVAGEVVGALCGRVEDVNLRVWRCG